MKHLREIIFYGEIFAHVCNQASTQTHKTIKDSKKIAEITKCHLGLYQTEIHIIAWNYAIL
jgi:hypothetical protein